ncbi:MAG: hypothetical protein HOO96_43540 [Polyangiaceae bacterium]|nr:hypothetical protein [Polyangiaceae bacterium]
MHTEWAGEHHGHAVVVARDELTRGFSIHWDGTLLGRRSWSWIGLGELHATAELAAQPVEVHVKLELGKCTVTVAGEPVAMTKAK